MLKLQAGFAQEIITPKPNEVYLDGYGFRINPADGISDEIYVKICAIKQGDEQFALVSLDVCGLSEDTDNIIRGHIAAINKLDAQKIAVCATHTHASFAGGILKDLPVNYLVLHRIAVTAGQAVKRAFDDACEGRFAADCGQELRYINNRRASDGSCDRRVKLLGFYDTADALKGVIVSASCHPVIKKNMLISADYPGILTRDAAVKYPGVPFLFLQGRCADINPAVPDAGGINEECEVLGGELRNSVFGALGSMNINTSGEIFLSSKYKKIKVPMLDYPDTATLEANALMFREKLYEAESPVDRRVFLRYMQWYENALKQIPAGGTNNFITVPVQIMTLSGMADFVFMPFEVFTSTGSRVEAVLNAFSMIIGYANGTYGYLAPHEEFAKGGYEITEAAYWYGLPQFSDESEAAVLAGITKLLN